MSCVFFSGSSFSCLCHSVPRLLPKAPSPTSIICVLAALSTCIIFTSILCQWFQNYISHPNLYLWTELQGCIPSCHFWDVIYCDASQISHTLSDWNCFIPLLTQSRLPLFSQVCNLASEATPFLTFTITRSTTDCTVSLLKIILLFSLTSSFNYFSFLGHLFTFFSLLCKFCLVSETVGQWRQILNDTFLLKAFVVMLAPGGICGQITFSWGGLVLGYVRTGQFQICTALFPTV